MTNSPACVEGAFPSCFALAALLSVSCSGIRQPSFHLVYIPASRFQLCPVLLVWNPFERSSLNSPRPRFFEECVCDFMCVRNVREAKQNETICRSFPSRTYPCFEACLLSRTSKRFRSRSTQRWSAGRL